MVDIKKGDTIQIYFSEDYFNYIKSKIQLTKNSVWEYEIKHRVEASHLYLDDYTHLVFEYLYKYGININRNYVKSFKYVNIFFTVKNINELGKIEYNFNGNTYYKRELIEKYFIGYDLNVKDMYKTYAKIVNSIKVSDLEDIESIDKEINRLQELKLKMINK